MQPILFEYLVSVNMLLDQIEKRIDISKIYDFDLQEEFLDTLLRFESLYETISYQSNMHDFYEAEKIVRKMGYVSIATISRKLNLIYNQSFKLVLEMERRKVVHPPNHKGIRYYNNRSSKR